ncbi:MAG: hypothetical protein ED559_00635 [Phycisphaera sp.]|nr:MAG: hypothetical protein ED559_00635 [Phycisphaera sp.]
MVGFEYAILNNEPLVAGLADAFAELGLPGMKHYVEAVEWGNMQRGPGAPIDFTKMDWFVREYQRAGFTELTVSLKPHCRWAASEKTGLKIIDPTPKPEYREHFKRWVSAVVERYDADGENDMPGLRWPVRYYEIGNEFSSYEPEPVDRYLITLALAYEAAHSAYDGALVGHAAFLTTPVNLDVDDPSEYDTVWATTERHDTHHGLEDMRVILDHPELFDILNLHNLGDPYEIEDQMRWLAYETGRRGYTKPTIISDTLCTSYIGWGTATNPRSPRRGVLARPATEEDRDRLAAYFRKLIAKDRETLEWTRGFVAADHVQRTVIAAEQGVRVINLAFIADIPWLKTGFFGAGAGISPWGGALRVTNRGRVQETYPLYHAIGQLMDRLDGYTTVERVVYPDDEMVRVYRVEKPGGRLYVAWLNPGRAILPEDDVPVAIVHFQIGAPTAVVETVITGIGQTEPVQQTKRTVDGALELEIGFTPVYVMATR